MVVFVDDFVCCPLGDPTQDNAAKAVVEAMYCRKRSLASSVVAFAWMNDCVDNSPVFWKLPRRPGNLGSVTESQ